VTTTTPEIQHTPAEQPRLTPGSWRVVPSDSHASSAARLAGRRVQGRLPLAGQVVIAESVEESAALLTARTSAVSTGSPSWTGCWADRLSWTPGLTRRSVPH
jgi:hypothetical protein